MTAGTAPPTQHSRPRAEGRATLRGDIEGLRAIAVMMVLLYHARVPGLDGGFAGVDVFFVISGYLITGLLVKEATRDGRISLSRFYARRARRLLPAASLVLAATALVGWRLLPEDDRPELGSDILGSTFYVVNWVLARREVDYLAEDTPPSMLQHYWSLSVEEQFYVLWPLLIMAVVWLARGDRARLTRLLTVVLVALVGCSLLWSVLRTADAPGIAYFASTTRAWQLGTGGLIVLLTPALRRLRPTAAHLMSLVGLAAVVATVVVVGRDVPWPGSAALLPTLGTAAVIAAGVVAPDNPVGRLLGRPPMLFLGALSYGLYLWHWPALRVLAVLAPDAGLPTRLLVAGVSILLAWASLRLVENPVRFHSGLGARPWRALAYGGTSMAVTGALGAALVMAAPTFDAGERDRVLDSEARGTSSPTSGEDPVIDGAGALGLVSRASRTEARLLPVEDPALIFTTSGEVFPAPTLATEDTPLRGDDSKCQVREGSTRIADDDACWFGDLDGDTTVALVGDSKMLQWLTALEPIARQEGWRMKVYTKSGCGFATVEMSEECHTYNEALARRLSDGEHTPDIVMTSMVRGGGDELGASVAALLQPVVDAGAEPVIVNDNPSPGADELGTDVTVYGCVRDHPDDYSACSYASGPGSGARALAVAADRLDAPFVDLSRWVCPDTGRPEPACPPVIGRVLAFRQGSHLTATYVASLTPILHHELIRAGVATTQLDQVQWRLPDVASG